MNEAIKAVAEKISAAAREAYFAARGSGMSRKDAIRSASDAAANEMRRCGV